MSEVKPFPVLIRVPNANIKDTSFPIADADRELVLVHDMCLAPTDTIIAPDVKPPHSGETPGVNCHRCGQPINWE